MAAMAVIFVAMTGRMPALAPQDLQQASIHGSVVRAGTGEPIAGARITYSRLSDQASARVAITTDSNGSFAITGMNPGSYRLTFAAPGYVDFQYGQKIPHGQGTPLELVAGQTVKELVVRLVPGGSIEGRVRESDGLPAIGVPVEVVRFGYSLFGKRSAFREAIVDTDDRGEYRLFWLTPGRYYLRAGGESSGRRVGLSLNSEILRDGNQVFEPFAQTFYPGAVTQESAETVEIRSGMDIKGIDFILKRQPRFRIRGKVIDSVTGRPPAASDISLSGENWGMGPWPDHYNAAEGTFELRNLWPGTYKVVAQWRDPATARGQSGPDVPKPVGVATVRIVDADVSDVVLQLRPPASLSGHVVLEGGATPPAEMRIQLQNPEGSVSQFLLPNTLSAPINPDGSFRIPQIIEGTYNVAVSESGYYVKQARYDGADVLSSPLSFVSGGVSSTLEVVVSSNVAQVSGTITDALLKPTDGAYVVLVPDKRRDNLEFFHDTTTDARGRYTLENIWPGDYKLYVWESIEYGSWFDPNVLKKYEQNARPVQLRESSRATVDTTHIPLETP